MAPSPEAAAFYLTVAAGAPRADLGPEWERRFSRSGLAHLLSVSGLHVAALALTVLGLLRLIAVWLWPPARHGDPRRFAALLAVPWVWAYVVFTGNQPPAVRSAVMASGVFVGLALGRRSDALNSLAAAVLILLAWDPSAVADLSLQLSVLAVLALLLVSPAARALLPSPPAPSGSRVRRALYGLREAALQSTSTSMSVTLASIPLVAGVFHQVSVAGIVTNLVCLPLGGVLTLLSAGGAAVFVASPLAATPVLWAGTRLSLVFLAVAERASASNWAAPAVPSLDAPASAVYLCGLGAWALGHGRVRWLGLGAPLGLLLAWGLPALRPEAGLTVTFLAVGHGDAIVISSGDMHALVDGGPAHAGERKVVPALRELGVNALALAVLSHPHADHALGLAETLEQLPTREVWLPAGMATEPLSLRVAGAARGARVYAVNAGWPPAVLGEAVVWPVGPPAAPGRVAGANDSSVVLRVRHGEVELLLTGDIEAPAESELAVGPASILKAPHHGSATSSTPDLIARVRPRYVIFCVARGGRFHFPDPGVEARYAASGARCLRTDRDGAIRVHSDGKDVQVQTYRRPGSPEGPSGWLPLAAADPTLPSG